MSRTRFATALLAAFLSGGCGGSDSGDLFGGGSAGQGAAASSGGNGGSRGATAGSGGRVLGGGGSAGEGGARDASVGPSCPAGATVGCLCDNGNQGTQTCEANGTPSPCECEAGTAPPPKPDGGADGPDPDCVPGHYKGKLTGDYKTASTLIPATVALDLPLDLHLTTSATRGFLDLDAKGSGNYVLVVPYSGHVAGRVTCKTGALVDGKLVGSYGSGPATTGYQGPVTGLLDPATGTFSGAWDAKELNPSYGGSGTWRAEAVPE